MTSKRKKPPTRKQIETCLKFVLSEKNRIQGLIISDIEAFKIESSFPNLGCNLPAPNGFGHYVIGRKAQTKLEKLSEKIITSDVRLSGRIDVSSYVQMLKREISTRLLNSTEIDEIELIESVTKSSIEVCLKSRTYFIPCIAPNWPHMVKFTIGSVKFWNKEYFYTQNKETFKESFSGAVKQFKEIYELQNWIAEITVHKFDERISEELANLLVRLALTSIKSQMDASNAKWLASHKQSLPLLRSIPLTQEHPKTEPAHIYFGYKKKFILNSKSDEVNFLLSHSSKSWFKLVGTFLNSIEEQGEWSFLQNKIVTAMIWLDTGNTPISNAERVVAYSNCLEAMFVTGETRIKDQVVKNTSKFLEFNGTRPELNDRIAEFYKARCDIVHGDALPTKLDFADIAYLGNYFTNICIEGFLYFISWLINKHKEANTYEHLLPFHSNNSISKALVEELPNFISEVKLFRASYQV